MAASVSEHAKRVEFRNGDGEKLIGTLVTTQSPKTVVLCHGFSDYRDTAILKSFATRLDIAELSSLRFDFSGNGESEGEFGFSDYEKEVEDLRAAIQYLRISGNEIHAIVGHSKAGNVVLLYAAKYDDVPHVINIAGRFRMDRGIAERYGADILEKLKTQGAIEAPRKLPDGSITTYKLTQKCLERRMELDMEKAAKEIRQSSVLTMHGTLDQVIPVDDAEGFAQCIAHHELSLIEGADHNFTEQQHLEALVERGVKFLT